MSILEQFTDISGPLEGNHRRVIVIHGMSTTADTLREGYPPVAGLTKIYWRLPILREGRTNLIKRREEDVFQSLFAAVIDESRKELQLIVEELGDGPVGLFGFSIGSLVALWGAIDNPQVRSVVTMGGVPNLDYLTHYYPDYPWGRPEIERRLRSYDVSPHMADLKNRSLCVMHGDEDQVAKWEWMEPAVSEWRTTMNAIEVRSFAHVQHRLVGESVQECAELARVRHAANEWFMRYL